VDITEHTFIKIVFSAVKNISAVTLSMECVNRYPP